jgi:type II secretory ATPase GspE/PulE/Tfp pilus assembly ATPase PilB-like protein
VVDYINKMFKDSIDIGASDIHIEPTEFFLLIRFRKDGDFLLYDKIHRENIS